MVEVCGTVAGMFEYLTHLKLNGSTNLRS